MFSKNAALFAIFLMITAIATPVLAEGDRHLEYSSDNPGQPAGFDAIVQDYLAIQTALAGDTIKGIDKHAMNIAKSAQSLSKNFNVKTAGVDSKNAAVLIKVLPSLGDSAAELSKAKDIKVARAAFGTLSEALVAYRKLVTGDAPNVAFCPMAKKSWLQNGNTISNPYYGSKMLRCGSIVSN